MHGAWTRGLYFHFRSIIWRHHRVPRPRFPLRRLNFGDSSTFKADILLRNICMGFQDIVLKWGFWGQNRGRGGAILTPNELVLTFRGSYVCANFGENRLRNATVRVLADRQTHRRKPILYYLSHAICYSYGTDKKWMFCGLPHRDAATYTAIRRRSGVNKVITR